jgi:choline dehydrogenase-like flavoprotein
LPDRYPGYDVLAKRNSPSWNEQTRRAIEGRLTLDPDRHTFFTDSEWPTVRAVCARVLAQEIGAAAQVPLAAMLDEKLAKDARDGYRDARLPPPREAWRRAVLALDAESVVRQGSRFHELAPSAQADLLSLCQQGELRDPAWGDLLPAQFFSQRLLHDVVGSYYAHPTAWNEIGYGGPASPRGYVRMNYDRRDPWEASEARPGRESRARRENLRIGQSPAQPTRAPARSLASGARPASEDAASTPRAIGGRAPDVFRVGGSVPMREYRLDEPVDFAIVGTGAGGGTLACRLAEHGFSVVAFDAGPYWRPLEDFASDEHHQEKLYWTDERIVDGDNPLQLGANNCGKSVGGSTVHFAMVSLRFRPEWFKARTLLGYGADWPLDWREMWKYYREVENALKISGPVRYPWGPKRPRYPYRPHELNAAALALAESAEALGIDWTPTPLATLSAPRGGAHPCVYRGMCVIGCSTNAKQSVLVTWLPRALAAGAEIRDLSMVTRIEHDRAGLVTGVRYLREGEQRFQRARNVVVAGYAIETPRLLLNSACPQFPDGLANSSGLVGKYFMPQSNHAVWGTMEEEIRWYKGPPCMAISEHWNYASAGKDFPGGYCFLSQGPLPIDWAHSVAGKRGLWGMELRREMAKYIHQAGLKIVGEVLPREANRIELAEETDALGLRIPRIVFSYGEEDKTLYNHALNFMREALARAGGKELWDESGTAHLLGGCRMGADPRSSVTDADGRSWDIPNLWICDGSLFPTGGGVNPSLTIQALACRIGDRIRDMARRGELARRPRRASALALR